MARKRETMDETELKTLVASEIRSALGYMGSGISEDRADNWDRYYAKPYGNERDGYSQVVSTDVMDTVEWIMPSLMRIFASGDEVVRFEPVGPEDEEKAAQATDYVNFVFNKDNPGVLILHSWFKDALVAKNGFVKFWWDESEDWKREAYNGLTDDAFVQLMQDQEIEPVEHTENIVDMPDGTGAVVQVRTHDVVIRRKVTKGRVCIEPVPPENFLIDRNAKTVEDARLVGDQRPYTISDLRADGVPEEIIERLGQGEDASSFATEEAIARLDDDGGPLFNNADSNANEAMRTVWVREVYMRVDYDGDGIAEMRRIRTAGNGHEILENEAWEGMSPYADLTPIPVPHKFTGIAVADLVKDLQLIKTTVLRQYLDGLYIANNPRTEVKQDQIVDPGEVTNSKAGGIVRTTGVGPALFPIQTAFVGPAALQGLEYIDTLRENRTGVTRYNQGIDANSLNKTATGVNQIMTAAQQRIELIARVFAETGVKRLFKGILGLVSRYQDQARMIRLRNKWVAMDPREWTSEFDTTVTVGLGNGNRDMMVAQLMQLLGIQFQAVGFQQGVQGPFVTGENLYNTVEKIVQYMGLKSAEPYFSDPTNAPPVPPKPDPEMMKVQGQMALEQQKAQQQFDLKRQEAQMKAEIELIQAQADIEVMRQKMLAEIALKREEAQVTLQLEREKAGVELQLKSEDVAMRAEDRRMAAQKPAAVVKYDGVDEKLSALEASVGSQLAAVSDKLAQAVETLAMAQKAPKRVVRGPDGKAIGVETVG